MRFWSLKTVRSTCFQRTSFHSYIGELAVLITCVLRLVLLPSNALCPRQHILWLSRRLWLLGQSLQSQNMRLAPAPRLTRPGRALGGYFVPEVRFAQP